MDAKPDLDGAAAGIGFLLDATLSHSFSIGARYSYLGAPRQPVDANGDGVGEEDGWVGASLLSGGPRFRLWTDEEDGQAWSFDAGAGYLWSSDMPNGPFAEVAVGRTAGFMQSGIGGDVGLTLRYQQGLGNAADYRALLFGFLAEMEFNARGARRDDSPSRLSYTLNVETSPIGVAFGGAGGLGTGRAAGAGLGFGIPLTAVLEPRVRAEALLRNAAEDDRDGLFSYVGVAEMRFRFDEYVPIQFGLGGGYAFHYGTPSIGNGGDAFLETSLSTSFRGCGDSGLELGLRGRVGLGEDTAVNAAFLTVGYSYHGGAPLIGERGYICRASNSRSDDVSHPTGARWRNTVRSEPPTRRRPPRTTTTVTAGSHSETHVEVEIQPPPPPRPARPVRIVVPMGLSLFGGAVQVDLSAAALPLLQLRRASFVEVRIEGPRGVHARLEGQLRAAAGRNGFELHAVQRITTRSPTTRLVFTLR